MQFKAQPYSVLTIDFHRDVSTLCLGPLISLLFLGFVGGWNSHRLGRRSDQSGSKSPGNENQHRAGEKLQCGYRRCKHGFHVSLVKILLNADFFPKGGEQDLQLWSW